MKMKTSALPHILRMFITATGAALSLAGCDEHTLYHTYAPLSSEGWERKESLCFPIDSLNRDAEDARFTVELRTTDAYPYQSVWLAVERKFSRPDTLLSDTVESVLADSSFRPTGKGIRLYQSQAALPPLSLRKGQRGQIRICHLMIRETLPGIHDVGVRIQTD